MDAALREDVESGSRTTSAGMVSFIHSGTASVAAFAAGSGGVERLRRQAVWFITLRWQAVGVSTGLILVACLVTGSLSTRLLPHLLVCVLALVAANVLFRYLCSRRFDPYRHIVLQVVIDLCILTALLHFSGGIENPLYALYVLHVIIAGILLRRTTVYGLTALACALLGLIGVAELRHWVAHYTFRLFPHGAHGGALAHASHDASFVASQVVSFSMVLFLTAYLTTLMSRRLRQSERELEQVADQALTERRRLESVVEAVGAGLILLSSDLRVLWFNQRIRDWFGLSDEHLGARCSARGWCADPPGEAICRAASSAGPGGPSHEEFSVENERGKRYFSITTAPIFDREGAVYQHAELIQDITARKVAEAQMLHAAKMAALGTLAAGIAHEIGNPLSSLSTRLKLMEIRWEPEFVTESVALLKNQIGRIQRIVRGVAQFGRPASDEWRSCDLRQILDEVMGLLRLDRRARQLNIRLETPSVQSVVMGVKDQLVQVFLNLGINAMEAMPSGGTLRFQINCNEKEISISVADTGSGIDDEVRSKLFSPFFTTKKDGTGLGLSISASIVNAHGGRICVQSSSGEGSTFTVTLPIIRLPPTDRVS